MNAKRQIASPSRLESLRRDGEFKAPKRSHNVRSLAKYAAHSSCKLATLGFAVGVDFDPLLDHTDYAVPHEQSPFIFRRGNLFEARLRDREYESIRALLREHLSVTVAPDRVKDLRPGGPRRLPARAAETTTLVRAVLRGEPGAPQLLDGAVLEREVAGRRSYFEADAVAVAVDGMVHAGEVKSFPSVDGQADPDKVGAAMAQVAIYVLLLEELVEREGGKREQVSRDAFLVTAKNTGLAPAMALKSVGREVDRADRILRQAPRAEDLVAELPSDVPSFAAVANHQRYDASRRVEQALQLAEAVGTDYTPSCLASCGMSRLCRERAHRCGDAARFGRHVERLLPGVDSLDRAGELAAGAAPAAEERAVAEQLVRVEQLRARFARRPR
jgi:hypothetical protein